MDNSSMISELRAALRRQGVWGPRAARLIDDWQEHVGEDTAQRVENGTAPDTAREAAWQALGSPNVLAAKAGCELASESWLGRHPWAAGLLLPLLAWVALICATCAFFSWMISLFGGFETLEGKAHATSVHVILTSWQVTMNWLPWLAAMAWLARIAARMPGGWKLYWITAIALTSIAPSIWTVVHWPEHGPGSGSVNVFALGFLGVIAKLVASLFGYGANIGSWASWVRGVAAYPGSLIQTATMALVAIAFYGRMSGGYRRAASSAGAIVLYLVVALVGIGFASL